ncbi:transcriptional regulator domain-containing protein [Sphingomonas morindae]|uniref:DUF6499 domain-containing protein n=1 Tax=Sphingomonas morindae TaxID=1541170 RepID=A0ABY4X3R5_9SPHN|nr:DUF6499 domain-containing protein [Sphingomonas morindae]USI71515.1 DUF6499 domain-containing protein [Sphingomonas morindae]
MTPDPSGWRISADYARAEQLSASDLGWEWLRRNERYDDDYQAFTRAETEAGEMTARIGERWGLRFPCRPTRDPAGYARLLAA